MEVIPVQHYRPIESGQSDGYILLGVCFALWLHISYKGGGSSEYIHRMSMLRNALKDRSEAFREESIIDYLILEISELEGRGKMYVEKQIQHFFKFTILR